MYEFAQGWVELISILRMFCIIKVSCLCEIEGSQSPR